MSTAPSVVDGGSIGVADLQDANVTERQGKEEKAVRKQQCFNTVSVLWCIADYDSDTSQQRHFLLANFATFVTIIKN